MDGVSGSVGGWFEESILKKVGDGSDTLFWTDPWLGGSLLCERFRRLFDLSENKSGSVA
ncbi:C-terminal binding protein, partial [Trifolium medium]|nr:C-terminal binding protein [Trifolium medium]